MRGMKNYKLVIFDLDGTLADTGRGIYNAHRHTLTAFHVSFKADDLDGLIGRELSAIYKDRFCLGAEKARDAVDVYRKWYAENGIYQVDPYNGTEDMLKQLKAAHINLAVATLKREDFAKSILERLGVACYFDVIAGMDAADTLNKKLLIRRCLEQLGVSASDAVMVGDTVSDQAGAEKAGIDFLAVSYGYGYREYDRRNDFPVATDMKELTQLLLGAN